MKTKLHLALLFFVALLLFTSTAFAQAALNFDGANDYLSKEAVISTNTTNFTIEAWVKWNGSAGNQAILYNGSTGGSGYGIYLLGGGQIAALMGGVAFVESGVSLTAGEWTHLAIARNSTTLTLYKNGISIATSTAAPYNPNGNFTIGSNHAGGELFNGNIDEVRFWTVERSQAQIKSNMNATLSVQANLLAYYTFSNGIPNANNAGITTIPDVSGNNNTLALNNFSLTGTASNFVQNFVEIYYVNAAATGDGRGHSWANAAPQLADVLKWARLQNNFTTTNPLKIYVAKGTYKPMYNAADGQFTTDGDRDNAFVMVNNVQLYGGFDPASGIDDLTDTRILPASGEGLGTILSGDIGTIGTKTDNAFHVVVSVRGVGNAALDGFTVSGGYSTSVDNQAITINNESITRYIGAGMYNVVSSPAIANCNFSENTASIGGGIYNYSSPASIINCNFTANTSVNYGGAMCNNGSSVTITNCSFIGNTASSNGGAMWNNSSSATITNCSFVGNIASFGGGMYNTGSSPNVISCIITGNTASIKGSGMNSTLSSSPVIINSTIANNGNNGFYVNYSTPILRNSIVWDAVTLESNGNYTATYSLIKGANPSGTGNIDATLYTETDIFTNYSAKDYTLKTTSPAINKGSNALFTGLNASTLDLAGNKRLISATIDLGAYENQTLVVSPDASNIIYVNAAADGTGNGSSWEGAIYELADALKWARQQNNFTSGNPLKIYLAKGTYKPMYNAESNAFTSATDRDNAFVMVSNVQLYGGFDPANNIKTLNDVRISPSLGGAGSVLSGDLGMANDISDNAYHLVIASGSMGNALLDGFTIADGNANGNSTTTVGSNILSDNYGAGIYNFGASLVYRNLIIKNNQVEWDGAGMINQNASPVVSNVLFTGNYAKYKGTIINYSNSSPVLANVTITGNTSDNYSGIFNGSSTAYIYNSIIWDNKINGNAATAGADIANDGAGHATVKNSLTQSYTTGNTADNNLVNTNPLFFNVANGDYTLGTASPAINKGSNAYYTDADKGNGSLTDKDLSGNKRLVNSSIDIGAYENQTLQTEPDANNILYVNLSATGDGSGNTWANAIPQLADALKWARAKNSFTTANPLKIYVAKGTYKPLYNPVINALTSATDRDNAFVMVNNVQIYGGFDPATGIDDLTDTRIFGSGGTILSGDIGTVGTNTDNTYHIVISSGAVGNALLDGFTLTGAYNAAANTGSVTINSNLIYRNYGGAMHNYNSSPAIANCSFTANNAYDGGGLYNSSSWPVVTNCSFSANTATYGGGIYNYASSPIVINCTFTTNTALTSGGGMYNNASSPLITNCRFTTNTVNYGGGMFNTSSSSPKLTNTTIANNGNNGFYNDGSGIPVLQNSIVWDVVMGTYTASYSLIKGANPSGTGNINATSLAATDIFTNYSGGNYTLKSYSQAINKGSNQLYWNTVNSGVAPPSLVGAWGGDLAGNPRVYKYADGGIIDIGAYEYQSTDITPDANNILYVNTAVSGGLSYGSSWANAIPQLADALKWARQKNNFTAANPLKIYVAKGTYKPLYNADDNYYTTTGSATANYTNRDNAFVMVNNVQIYGGFDPDNGINALTDSRLLPSLSGGAGGGSILSGDIGIANDNIDNTYHVVISSGAVGSALLDGFIVTGAYSTSANWTGILVNGNSIYRNYGGMHNYSSSPAVANCSFTANTTYYGGGMYNFSSSLRLTNCNFTTNTAAIYGGGMYNIISSPTIINCNFTGNTSSSHGSGMYNGSSSSPTLTNTTIANNGSVGFYTVSGGTSIFQNTIIWDAVSGSYTASYSLIKGANPSGTGNINASNLAATDIFTNYLDGDYTLKSYSPVINKGSNQLYWDVVNGGVAPPSLAGAGGGDLAGNPRVYKYANGGIIDIGAYEYQSTDITPGANNIIYVNTGVLGGDQSGRSWANAIPQLADALKWARTKNNFTSANPLKIYVAKGAYKPMYNAADASYTTDGGRDNAFVMVNNVQIYGGFDPDNGINALTDARSLPSSGGDGGGSILSGDIGTEGTATDNTYHVVVSSGAVGTARLDGFTITGAYSTQANSGTIIINGNSLVKYYGGGMSNYSSSPVVSNCSFTGNASYLGGGISNHNSSPTLTNISITGNTSSSAGAGISNRSSSSPKFTNVSIRGNTATSRGGGVWNDTSSPTLTNVSISGNKTINGDAGGVCNYYSSATLINVTISGNTAPLGAGGIYNVSSNTKIYNSIIWGNNTGMGNYNSTPEISYSIVQGGYTGTGNLNANPLFVSSPAHTTAPFTVGDYTLKTNSPAIAKGDNTLFTGLAASTLDLAGNPRVYNYATGGTIDLGAYEYQGLTSQTITFAALDPKTTSTADFVLTATASSTLAVTYTSSNTAVAEVYQDGSVWKVKINGEGNTNITASQTGNSDYSAATSVVQQLTIIGAPLPVTLISYTAKTEGSYAKLQWQTSAETNNKGFEIYRAVESEKQKAESKENTTFVKIGEVSAPVTHNTQPVTQYNFTDKTPLNGNNYYKLVQVDNNGKATELGVRTVAFNFPLSTFNLYPNPTTNKITVTFNQGKYHLLTLSDNLGKVLQQQSIGVQSVDVVVDLTTYPIGIYFITLQSANESITKKVIKR